MTISFNMLGHHGRLGNQMFQYATLKSIAMKHGYDFTIPPSDFNDPYHDHQLFEGFELSSVPQENIRINNVDKRAEEGHFHFNQALYEQCPDLSLIHISEPTRRRGISYAVFCLKKKKYRE